MRVKACVGGMQSGGQGAGTSNLCRLGGLHVFLRIPASPALSTGVVSGACGLKTEKSVWHMQFWKRS